MWALPAELSAGCCGAGSLSSPGGWRWLRAPAEGLRACVPVSSSLSSPPSSVSELSVFSNKLSALLLPRPPPGLLLCGCWRLLVVTGECVCVLGPGGSVCISHRYAPERRARGSDGTRGRDCQAGLCPRAETWPEGRINGSACAECGLFLLPPPPLPVLSNGPIHSGLSGV